MRIDGDFAAMSGEVPTSPFTTGTALAASDDGAGGENVRFVAGYDYETREIAEPLMRCVPA